MRYLTTILLLSTSLASAGDVMVCMKNGKVLAVEGDTPAEKRMACEKARGSWEKQHEVELDHARGTGGGGGW